MGTRNKRTARRFQVEPLEIRWTPGGASGAVLLSGAVHHIGEEITQVQVAPVACGSNTVRGGQEGSASPVACGSKPGITAGSN
jgi:hypothetical protein